MEVEGQHCITCILLDRPRMFTQSRLFHINDICPLIVSLRSTGQISARSLEKPADLAHGATLPREYPPGA